VEDVTFPRGQDVPRVKGARISPRPLVLAFVTLAAVTMALAVLIALTGDASDGDPVVSLVLAPLPSAPQTATQKPQAAPGPRLVNGNLVADPALLERTSDGVLPVVAADGRTPMQAYARAFNLADPRPRVAIVIGGLGISASATKLALDHLPPATTLSFAPYAAGVQRWVDAARGLGHEVLVEVPMEPFDFPASNPGPHTLTAAVSAEENVKQLAWTLSRFTGYVGVTNLLGGRFLGEAGALDPVLAALGKRGLLFFDNGASSRSVAAETAGRVSTSAVTGAVILDAVQSREAIDAKLAELESRARAEGAAAASGFLYPVTIQEVAQWAPTLEKRGLVLAPITATLSPATKPSP
jgi:uncharacterized protein